MELHQKQKLSSNWTIVGLYSSGVFVIVASVMFTLLLLNKPFQPKYSIGLVFLPLSLAFVIYQFIYVCEAWIIDNQVFLKKQFREGKYYSLEKIGTVKSFQWKSTSYISVKMKEDKDKYERYLILNSRSFLFSEDKDAKRVLMDLRDNF